MNNWRKVLFVLVGSMLFFSACKTEPKKEIKTNTITFTKEGELTISKSETDSIIASLDIEIAETDYETQTGLMYRESMEQKQGMLFIFPDVTHHSFYMKNTQIPLDIIFIDENLKIDSFQKNAQPLDESGLPSEGPVKFVLEINAGLSDQWGLEVGDTVAYSRN
ncbi:DUF192 domain-containing protein [Flagellimonas algicola]|uniref:DUF192 domain-containing protein n=1 Tax=Flagellimonas algicola TaxID=2583815 RepID=A0ABY2WQY1_9FLAO|nr:DUF192 domain-containing protein [Allomuricauda algicola]TMU57407.1 DUF192 domain-containing protein [Allomuricauda algicola]